MAGCEVCVIIVHHDCWSAEGFLPIPCGPLSWRGGGRCALLLWAAAAAAVCDDDQGDDDHEQSQEGGDDQQGQNALCNAMQCNAMRCDAEYEWT